MDRKNVIHFLHIFKITGFQMLGTSLDFRGIICRRSQITIFYETVSYRKTDRVTFFTINDLLWNNGLCPIFLMNAL